MVKFVLLSSDLALLARALGHEVSGSDTNVYPPMSTQLAEQGIELMNGYDPDHLLPAPDLIIIGNTMSRGNPVIICIHDFRVIFGTSSA